MTRTQTDSNSMLNISNFITWNEYMMDESVSSWGLRSNLFSIGKVWERAEESTTDFKPREQVGRNGRPTDPYLPADIRRFKEYMQRDHNKDKKNDININCQFFSYIESKISKDSKTIIRTNPLYKNTRAVFNVQGLYNLIVYTHHIIVGGCNLHAADENKRTMVDTYYECKQKANETILDYLKGFTQVLSSMQVLEADKYEDADMVIHFLDGLNINHEEFKASVKKRWFNGQETAADSI